jgi:hypothetical protein
MPGAETSQSFAPAPVPEGPGAPGVWEWIWRGSAVRSARERARSSALRRERLRRAQLAAQYGDRALEPSDPPRNGAPAPLAISLYREAAHWALLAHSDDQALPGLREALAGARVTGSDLNEQDIAAARSALADKTFIETADDRPEVQQRDAELCQRYVYGLIGEEAAAGDRVSALLTQRYVRAGFLLIVLLCALFAAKSGIERAIRGPDLALGKRWTASTKAFDCHPDRNECGGAQTAIFFHTNEENQPWLEYDLGTPQQIARVRIVNRDDCCIDRAVPLAVEVSDDRAKWRTVAQQKEAFRSADISFDPVKARFVRLRVTRRAALHLTSVTIHAR